jgi:hypothetical protein
MSKFIKLIERMEDLILSGTGIPLTPFTVLNGDKLVPLLDRIRESLPDEVRASQKVIEQRDQLLEEAHRQAVQMLTEAKERAERALSESELLKAVQSEAERVRQQVMVELEAVRKKAYEEAETLRVAAHEEARTIREESERYAEAVMGTLDKTLSELHVPVREGHKRLRQARQESVQSLQAIQSINPGVLPRMQPAQAYTSADLNRLESKSLEDLMARRQALGASASVTAQDLVSLH